MMKKSLKNDIILISCLLILVVGLFIGVYCINQNKKDGALTAHIYFEDELIKEINLNEINEEEELIVIGKISEVVIIINHNSIYVKDSGCPDHICINEGIITEAGETITCMPNRIYITLTGMGADA